MNCFGIMWLTCKRQTSAIYLRYVCFCNKYILLVRVLEHGTGRRSAELTQGIHCYTWVSILL